MRTAIFSASVPGPGERGKNGLRRRGAPGVIAALAAGRVTAGYALTRLNRRLNRPGRPAKDNRRQTMKRIWSLNLLSCGIRTDRTAGLVSVSFPPDLAGKSRRLPESCAKNARPAKKRLLLLWDTSF